MMTIELKQILQGIPGKWVGDDRIRIAKMEFDSRKVQQGDLFVAVPGTVADGHNFISKAIAQGAAAILCERLPEELTPGVTFYQVGSAAWALGVAASNYYGNPSREMKVVGVTGTNGKTSIATLLYRLFTRLGYKVGLLSTVRYLVNDVEITATHTTPDPLTIQRLFRMMVDAGCSYAFMEVSSHALDQARSAGIDFDGAIFTNLTHDHLDYHKTVDSYLKAKKRLFDELPGTAFALVNVDDRNGRVMVQNTAARVSTFGVRSMADFKGKIIESHFDGMQVQFNSMELWLKLIGEFNASNMLAVYGAACLLGADKQEVLRLISCLETVDGRFEYVRSNNGVTAIVDYAHTPDALKNVLETINQIKGENARLITVVGAGGDRDRTKRPKMAAISLTMSQNVILTSDNPRSEEPQAIIDEMMAGVEPADRNRVLSICDRHEAIRAACLMAQPGDVVLIAGKGHETYQEVKGVRSHFDDKEEVRRFFDNNNNLQ